MKGFEKCGKKKSKACVIWDNGCISNLFSKDTIQDMSRTVTKVITEKEIRVRYAETDKMGITYHSNYFVWFEVARIHMLDELGVVYRTLEDEGYFLPVVECQARFLSPVRFDDVVRIVTALEVSNRAKFRIDYEVWCEDRQVTKGYTYHAFMDIDGRVTRPPERFLNAVSKFAKVFEVADQPAS
jgi:acyl-CoA thioester hydrolase